MFFYRFVRSIMGKSMERPVPAAEVKQAFTMPDCYANFGERSRWQPRRPLPTKKTTCVLLESIKFRFSKMVTRFEKTSPCLI
jgi:hypothetical protein